MIMRVDNSREKLDQHVVKVMTKSQDLLNVFTPRICKISQTHYSNRLHMLFIPGRNWTIAL